MNLEQDLMSGKISRWEYDRDASVDWFKGRWVGMGIYGQCGHIGRFMETLKDDVEASRLTPAEYEQITGIFYCEGPVTDSEVTAATDNYERKRIKKEV